MGGSPPDTLGSAARMVALITAHQGNDKAEYRRLDETRDEIHRLEVLPRAIEISLRIEAELIDANEIAAEDADYVGDQVLVSAGLSAGEAVVVDNYADLSEGARIQQAKL